LEKLLGEGSTAQVISISEDTVAKLFREHVSTSAIDHEFLLSKHVMDSGLPVPAIYRREIIKGKQALIYEKINGSPLTKRLNNPGLAFRLMKQMADLHANVHEKQASHLPLQKESLKRKIERVMELTAEEKRKILSHLSCLPDDNSLCHGDFHPDNILLSEDGPFIIDWTDATTGNRIADVARTMLIMQFGGFPEKQSAINRKALLFLRKRLSNHYLKSYKKHFHLTKDSLRSWILPVAAGRLSEKLPVAERKQLLAIIRKMLKEMTR
jgi:Ser/Thr protein kinase RdoA (MazF antagonist)